MSSFAAWYWWVTFTVAPVIDLAAWIVGAGSSCVVVSQAEGTGMITGIIIGLLLGVPFGVIIGALCFMAKRTDKAVDPDEFSKFWSQ